LIRNEYCFESKWCFEARVEDIVEILFDIDAMPRWWTPVCLDARCIEPGDDNLIGLRVQMLTRGQLPYSMSWEFLVTEHEPLRRVAFQLFGETVGHAEWNFEQRGEIAEAQLSWSLRVEQPFVKRFSWLLRPAFSHNHCWSMEAGQHGLCAELKRRGRLRDQTEVWR
jgi:hypothetical protein